MPRKRKRPDIGRRSRVNVQRATLRSNRTNDQREADNDNSRTSMGELRSRVNNYEVDRQRMERVRAHRSQQQRARDNKFNRFRRRNAPVNLERGAFSYDTEIEYSADKSVTIGEMSIICQHCKALKYSCEPAGLCCAGGKVQLPHLDVALDAFRNSKVRFTRSEPVYEILKRLIMITVMLRE